MATTSDAGPVPDRDAPDRGTHRTCFISYSRLDESVALELESDLEALGLGVWRDTQLTGGQDWWDTVLDNILGADVVIFLISSASLESVPCARELEYATAARRHILPVRIDPAVLPRRSSPLLAALEWTDYRPGDKRSTVDLVRALGHLPPSPPVPDPPPAPPPVPLSYTTNLAALARSEEVLSRDEQFHVLGELRTGLRSPTDRAECLAILTTLRGRRDLLAAVADEIDELLARYGDRARGGGHLGGGGRQDPRPVTGGGGRPPGGTAPPPAGAPHPPERTGSAGPPPVGPVGTAWVGQRAPVVTPAGKGAQVSPVPAARQRPRWLVPVLVVVGVVAALVVAVAVLFGEPDPPWTYGDDARLDELTDLCGGGDFTACNDLYGASEAGSEYEAFAESCGGAWEGTVGGACPPQTYGENTALDELEDRCGGGDFEACTDLYASSPAGSEYEAFGESCGGAWEGAVAGACPPQTYGDHSRLDELWDLCETGDVAACGTLYADSPAGSEYEAFGESCGGGGCAALTYGGDPALDPLWDACAAGDMAQCDALYLEATPGSEYETFGSTCGYLADPLSGGCVGSF